MQKVSCGLVMYKKVEGEIKVLLVHPGGPFWRDKDLGAWSIPKGEINEGEDFLLCAKREFEEEIGVKPSSENFISLGEVKQKSGKVVHAWAFEGDFHGFLMRQNMIEIEWPYKSGKKIKIPEVDKVEFFDLEKAREKINSAQVEFLVRLKEKIS